MLLLGAACGGGGYGPGGPPGGGAGGGGGTPPPDASQILPTIGLTSLAAGVGAIQARWDARDPDGLPVAVALFLSTDKATLFQAAPVLTAAASGKTLLTGLVDDQPYWVGLAVDLGGGQYSPSGAQLSATPGTVFYVDAASTVVNPDGSTPATAFSSLIEGALVASSLGGAGIAANVWVAAGDYANVAVPVGAGVHLYGGFDATFDLANRNPLAPANRTTLNAQPAKAVLEITAGTFGAVVDGFRINGVGATFGVDIDTSNARLSSLEVFDCTGRGIRLRSISNTDSFRVSVAHCSVLRSGAEGLSAAGAFKLDVEGSRFSSNGLEGLDMDDLVAPDGFSAKLSVRDSTFFGNGEDGLDCDLGAPPLGGASGNYEVAILGSHFERNGWKSSLTPTGGMKIDIEFEGFPGWTADILVRGCTARANRGAGVHLDLDSTSTTLIHRLLSTANGADGLLITSESAPSLATVSASAFVGNQGAGVRVSGSLAGANVPVAMTHSIVSGNQLAGLSSEFVESSAASSAAWIQTAPWSGAGGVLKRGTITQSDPLSPLFVTAPEGYLQVTAFDGTLLTLDDASALAVNDELEVADDGTSRQVTGFAGVSQVAVNPLPTSLDVPALCARFGPGAGVLEDWQLAVGSAAIGAGMKPPTAPAPDAGVFGSPSAGLPGVEDAVPAALFMVAATTPPTTTALAQNDSIAVTFLGGALDSLSITGNVQVRNEGGQVVTISAPFLQSGQLIVPAPGGGWPVGQLTLELFAGLETTDSPAIGLVTPLALPFRVQ